MVQVTAKSRAHAENLDSDNNGRGSVGIGVEEGAEVHCRTRVVQLLLLGLGQLGDRLEDTWYGLHWRERSPGRFCARSPRT